MAETTRVVLYARTSTRDKQDHDNQFLQLREFASRQGWTIVHEYVDQMSGGRKDRPQLKKLLDGAYRKEFDVLLFWALDRLTREGVTETLNYLKQLDSYGVAWHSHTERYLTSALGEFKDVVISVLAAVARQEKIRIQERVKAGLERAKVKGTKSGLSIGRPKAEDDLKLMQRFRKLHDEGVSVRKMAAKLDVSPNTIMKLKDIVANEDAA